MKKLVPAVFIIICGVLLFGGRPAPEGPLLAGEIQSARTPGDPLGGASAWTPIGPYGGEIQGLARNPKYANELYAIVASYPGQFFKSTNNGLTWTRTAVFETTVLDVATDPKDPKIVYVYTVYRLYKSSDRGGTFPDKESFSFPNDFLSYSGRMAIHPSNSKIIYLAGYFMTDRLAWKYCPAVCRSSNGGQTWTVVKLNSGVQRGDLFDVRIHPKKPNIIYLCGNTTQGTQTKTQVYVSTNSGGSYKNITKDSVFNAGGGTYYKPYGLALHPTDINAVLVAHYGGIARTTDGGGSWQNQSSPKNNFSPGAVALDTSKPNTLYALNTKLEQEYRGCWKSTDGGKNWTHYGNGIYGCGTRLLVSGNTVIAGTWAGIFKSLNAGVLWKASHSGMRASRPDSFGVAPSSVQTIYTEVGGYALFKTANGGGAWTKCPDFYRCESILGFVVHPSNPKSLFFLAGG